METCDIRGAEPGTGGFWGCGAGVLELGIFKWETGRMGLVSRLYSRIVFLGDGMGD